VRSKLIVLSIFVVVSIFPMTAVSGWFGSPSDYDECILKNMKGVTSDLAAKLVRRSCIEKFPKKERHTIELSDQILKKIDGKAGIRQYGDFEGQIFNGNENWTITSLTIRIVDNTTRNHRDYKTAVTQAGYVSSPLPPLSKGSFKIKPYDIPEDRSWFILNGRGYKN